MKIGATTLLALTLGVILGVLGCGSGGSGGGGTSSTGGGETTSATVAGKEVTSVPAPSTTLSLTPSGDSDVSGTATLTQTPGGLEVRLDMQNLIGEQVGTEHPAHIHEGGTCADDRAGNGAPVRYALTPVITAQDGTGTSTTVLQGGLTLDQLSSGPPKYINVHAAQVGDETPPGISCADLSASGGETTGAAAGGESTAAGYSTQ
jgi:Cu/Zn superoxide dismutase